MTTAAPRRTTPNRTTDSTPKTLTVTVTTDEYVVLLAAGRGDINAGISAVVKDASHLWLLKENHNAEK